MQLVLNTPVCSHRAGKLGGVGQTGQKIPFLAGSHPLHRPDGTDTAEPFQPLPFPLSSEPGNIRTQPRFPLLYPSVVFSYLAIPRFANPIFLE